MFWTRKQDDPSTRREKPSLRLRIPWIASSIELGLGDCVKDLLMRVGFRPCGGCARRAAALNRILVLSGSQTSGGFGGGAVPAGWRHGSVLMERRRISGAAPRRRWRLRASAGAVRDAECWSFTGPCTGFGKRVCVEAPASQDPDAEIIQQCCGGWFLYPWIEVCPGQRATQGCGFCFW
jgi:hypothetical protein